MFTLLLSHIYQSVPIFQEGTACLAFISLSRCRISGWMERLLLGLPRNNFADHSDLCLSLSAGSCSELYFGGGMLQIYLSACCVPG